MNATLFNVNYIMESLKAIKPNAKLFEKRVDDIMRVNNSSG